MSSPYVGVALSLSTHARPSFSQSTSKTRVVTIYKQPVDENNPEVQLLLEAETVPLEECIRAIEIFETADVALDHMTETEEGVFFHEAPVTMQHEIEIPIHTQPVAMRSGTQYVCQSIH